MHTGLLWTVIGSVAGALTVLVAVIFGVIQVRQGKKNARPSQYGAIQSVEAGRDAYTAGGDQHIVQDRRQDQ
jgi:hypothetical protein